jgi:hypothetical protein
LPAILQDILDHVAGSCEETTIIDVKAGADQLPELTNVVGGECVANWVWKRASFPKTRKIPIVWINLAS